MEAEERPNKKRRLTGDEDLENTTTANVVSETVQANDPLSNGQDVSPRDDLHKNGTSMDDTPQKEPEHDNSGAAKPNEPNGKTLPPPNTTAPIADSLNTTSPTQPISKNQQKKLQKQLDWESKRDERKLIRKQKLIAKRERKRLARDQAIENGELPLQPPPERQKSLQLPVTILIDCDFDDLMREPERKSLAAQITRSYSDNRKAPFRSHLGICSFGGELRKRFDDVLTHYKSWKGVKFLDCDFVETAEEAKGWMTDPKHGGEMAGVFSKHQSDPRTAKRLQDEAEVVYLTSESDNTLTELKPFSTYIIGGLVDKNREKGICYKRASARGVKTARLPIGEFMDMQSRKVLATNHVNEIMVRWLECGDWGEAFMTVIPKRKGGKLKGDGRRGDEDGGGEVDEMAGAEDGLSDEEADEGGGKEVDETAGTENALHDEEVDEAA